MQSLPLGVQERIIYQLRSLYTRYVYSQYKMSKFEEYDLYARNKDFLISDSVITFTDLNGKLMALKPDVTLSIVKNSKDLPDTVQKLYYNENIYRVAKGSRSFREIMQVGLECLGSIDNYCICEVLTLAAESLRSIASESILSISHLGLLSDVIEGVGIPKEFRDGLLKAVGEKNLHEITQICSDCGVSCDDTVLLKQLIGTKGTLESALAIISGLLTGRMETKALQQLQSLASALHTSPVGDMLRFDLSVVDDLHYYNGIVFKGFISGVPTSVLSGGQYDKLMKNLGRKSAAIGFAVYMDTLERLDQNAKDYDVDILLQYDDGDDLAAVAACAKHLREQGINLLVQRSVPENVRYRQLCKFCCGEVKVVENHA